jgi:hypothetical protein
MKAFAFRSLAVVVISFSLISLLSCGHDQKLVSITLTPSSVIFEGVGAQVQFLAVGQYIHPPQNKDITGQVQWQTDIPGLVTFSSTTPGLVTAQNACGSGQVLAVVYSNPSNPPRGTITTGVADVKGALEGTASCP